MEIYRNLDEIILEGIKQTICGKSAEMDEGEVPAAQEQRSRPVGGMDPEEKTASWAKEMVGKSSA